MKKTFLLPAYKALKLWSDGKAPLYPAEELLGDHTGSLGKALAACHVVGTDYKPLSTINPADAYNIAILYLAMRHGKSL